MMRFLVVLFLLVFNCSLSAQAQQSQIVIGEAVHEPQLVVQVPFGERVAFGDVEIELTRVIDSRCPQNTTCVWAGIVEIEALVFKNGKPIESRKINLNSPAKTLFNSSAQELMGQSVLPYPDASQPKIKQEDYVLNVVWSQF